MSAETAVDFVKLATLGWVRLGRPEKAAETLCVGVDYLDAVYGKSGWLP